MRFEPETVETGRAKREGDRPVGFGVDERGGRPEPAYLRCVKVSEKIACDRDDWAFISVSFVRRIAVP